MIRSVAKRFPALVGSVLLAASFTIVSGSVLAGERPIKTGEIKPELIYHNYCSVCHGDRGNGDSRAKGSLNPPPRDFTSATNLSRDTMITIVTHGKSGTAMVPWKSQLSDKEIAAVVDYIRDSFMVVALDPRLQRGKTVYVHNCAVCHGERGQGSSNPIGGLVPARNLASPQSRAELSRERMLNSVTNGRPGTAMAGFTGRLPAEDIEAVVDYVRTALMVPETKDVSGIRAHGGRGNDTPLATPQVQLTTDMNLPFAKGLKGDAAKGEKFYNANCATCHGVKGDGQGPRAYFINPKPRNFIAPQYRTVLNRPVIYSAVSMGRLGTEMPAWSKVLNEQEIADVSEYVYEKFIRPVRQPAAKK
ncbi:MAG TPA: c-type cytochrome [Rhodocyclaceae bacterium]